MNVWAKKYIFNLNIKGLDSLKQVSFYGYPIVVAGGKKQLLLDTWCILTGTYHF